MASFVIGRIQIDDGLLSGAMVKARNLPSRDQSVATRIAAEGSAWSPQDFDRLIGNLDPGAALEELARADVEREGADARLTGDEIWPGGERKCTQGVTCLQQSGGS